MMKEINYSYKNVFLKLKTFKKSVFQCILLQLIIFAIIVNYVNLKEIVSTFFMLFIISFIIKTILYYTVLGNKHFLLYVIAFEFMMLTTFLGVITRFDNIQTLKLDYVNNQIIDTDTNKKITPLFKWNNFSTKEGIDKFKNCKNIFCESASTITKRKILIDDNNDYYIVEYFLNENNSINSFLENYFLKEIDINENAKSIKFTYINKENKQFYEFKENMPKEEFDTEKKDLKNNIKGIKINEFYS